MKLFTKISIILSIIMISAGFTACNSDDTPGMPDNTCFDFVTFVSSSDKGSVFEFRKSGDSELITLTAQTRIDSEKIKPGTRLIIQYIPSGGQKPYESGAITLYGIAQVINGKPVEKTHAEIEAMHNEPIKMVTIGRSGNYVDIWAQGFGAGGNYTFEIVLDQETADSEYPEAYLVYTYSNIEGSTRQIYASFDISDVLSKTTSKGININYYTSTGMESSRLDKSMTLPIEPVEPVE